MKQRFHNVRPAVTYLTKVVVFDSFFSYLPNYPTEPFKKMSNTNFLVWVDDQSDISFSKK